MNFLLLFPRLKFELKLHLIFFDVFSIDWSNVLTTISKHALQKYYSYHVCSLHAS